MERGYVGQAFGGVAASALILGLAACGGSGHATRTTKAPAAKTRAAGSIVDIKGSSPVWRDLLIKSVGIPNTTVRLAPNIDMDMTGLTDPIYFAGGVMLTSEQPVGPVAKDAPRGSD